MIDHIHDVLMIIAENKSAIDEIIQELIDHGRINDVICFLILFQKQHRKL